MTLAEQIDADFINAISNTDEFAQQAVYKKYKDGTTVSVSVIIEDVNFNGQYSEGRFVSDNATIFAYLDFDPNVYDTVTIDGVVWVVDSFSSIKHKCKLNVSKEKISTRKHTMSRFR